MRRLIVVALLVAVFYMPCYADNLNKYGRVDRVDPPTQTQQREVLRYNSMNNSWGYERQDTQLQYNPNANEWKYAPKDAHPRYNPLEHKWGLSE